LVAEGGQISPMGSPRGLSPLVPRANDANSNNNSGSSVASDVRDDDDADVEIIIKSTSSFRKPKLGKNKK
jgi:hypothetical protein